MTHIQGQMKQEGTRFHHTMQNSMQLKTYELFIFRIFNLIFWTLRWLWVTDTIGEKTVDKEETTEWCPKALELMNFPHLVFMNFVPISKIETF